MWEASDECLTLSLISFQMTLHIGNCASLPEGPTSLLKRNLPLCKG